MRQPRTSEAKSEEALQLLSWLLEILGLKMVTDSTLSESNLHVMMPESHGEATYRLFWLVTSAYFSCWPCD